MKDVVKLLGNAAKQTIDAYDMVGKIIGEDIVQPLLSGTLIGASISLPIVFTICLKNNIKKD